MNIISMHAMKELLHRACCLLAIALCLPTTTAFAAAPEYERDVLPFLKRHCYSCHDAKQAKAGFRLDQLGTDFLRGTTADDWHEVINQINSGAMPPKDQQRPDPKAAFVVVEWVGAKLKEAEKLARMSGGRILMRRLNRQEYANTVGDLFQLDSHFVEKLKRELPADGKAEGFDRISSALFFDQTQMASYLEWTAEITREAVQDAPPLAQTYAWEANRHLGEPVRQKVNENLDHMIETGPPTHFKTEKGMLVRSSIRYGRQSAEFIDLPPGPPPSLSNFVKQDGYYRIRIKGGSDAGERGEPIRVRLVYAGDSPLEQTFEFMPNGTLDKPEVTELIVFLRAGQPDMTKNLNINWNGLWDARINHPVWEDFNLRILVANGQMSKAAADKNDELLKKYRADLDKALADAKAFTGTRWIHNEKYNIETLPKLLIDTIEVEGPVVKEWPPASHVALGLDEKTPADEAGLREVFSKLLPRAYRRPGPGLGFQPDPLPQKQTTGRMPIPRIEAEEIDRLVNIAAKAMRDEKLDFKAALRLGLQTMLVSPGFVFLQEPQASGESAARPLNDYELASRLSYFLWSSLPDDELFAIAAKGGLRDASTLRAQVTRMLADPKSRRFVENFAGQWLDVEQFGSVEPALEYKDYDAKLKAAEREEPLAFFQQVLSDNLPVTNFLDSQFLVVNERLARHYGIDGVTGDAFQKVTLRPEHHRGGVLGMAGLMTLLSDGTRTLPVRRGAWVLERLLNDPPPPPPPNAGEIQPNTTGVRLTVRERLAKHRSEPNCASCHAKLDSYGLALENYDAIGRWRERQNGEGISGPQAPMIDPSGALKSGREFSDLAGYKAGLLAEKEKFVRAFSEKLLTYALGRAIGYIDNTTLEQITTIAARSDHRMQDLIHAVVSSEPFLTK
jgi:hypothetical protein